MKLTDPYEAMKLPIWIRAVLAMLLVALALFVLFLLWREPEAFALGLAIGVGVSLLGCIR